jgi:hypothetical protein
MVEAKDARSDPSKVLTHVQIGDFAGVADGPDHAIAAPKELIGELATEAIADTGDELNAL